MIATEPMLALAWDEAYTLARLDRVHAWITALRDPTQFANQWQPDRLRPLEDRRTPPTRADIDTPGKLLNGRNLAWFWPFAREEPHGHPAFYAVAALAGDLLTPGRSDLARARLGTMIAFSLAAGAAYTFSARRWGTASGLIAASAWIFHPHLFALGHYATYDGLLASLWLLVTLAFAQAVEPDPTRSEWLRRTMIFGLLTGLAMSTKLTGWFLPVPLAVWVLVRRDTRGLATLALGGMTGLLVLWVMTPPFWPDPIGGLIRFFRSNLSRSQTIPIKTQFLGIVYETPTNSLPWYNTLVWVAVATPVGFLSLALGGAIRSIRRIRTEPVGLLLLLSASTLLVLRALPHTPGHDGTRQIAVSFGGLAMLAGLGAQCLINRWPRAGRAVIGLSIAEGIASVALMMPVPLSYYSPIVGGLPGATRLGMEPTYYWDTLTPGALARLDSQVLPGRTVLFIANPVAWYHRQTGGLHAGLYPTEGREIARYVVQNRPGAMSSIERDLVRRLGERDEFILLRKLGVPLVWSFPAQEVTRSLKGRGDVE